VLAVLSYVVVSLLRQRFQTPAIKRTLSPNYNAKDATFDFPIYASLLDHTSTLELVIWDKDVLRKEYCGEAALRVEDWFKSAVAFDDLANEVCVLCPLVICQPPFHCARAKIGSCRNLLYP